MNSRRSFLATLVALPAAVAALVRPAKAVAPTAANSAMTISFVTDVSWDGFRLKCKKCRGVAVFDPERNSYVMAVSESTEVVIFQAADCC